MQNNLDKVLVLAISFLRVFIFLRLCHYPIKFILSEGTNDALLDVRNQTKVSLIYAKLVISWESVHFSSLSLFVSIEFVIIFMGMNNHVNMVSMGFFSVLIMPCLATK